MAEKTKVILYTPWSLQAEAWSALLEEEIFLELLGTTDRLEQVSRWSSGEARTAVIVDVPQPSSHQAERASQAAPQAGLLFLVDSYDLEILLPLIRAGAMGCISRSASRAYFVRALIAVGRGELALPDQVASEVLFALARDQGAVGGHHEELTEREREVLAQLANGLTNKDIAQELILSVRTVEAHLRSVYAKLNVTSRTEAALWAVQNGYAPEWPEPE